MDKLEKFILQNREAFDDAVPSLKVWAGIDQALEKKPVRRVSLRQGLRIAAAVVFLLLAGGTAGLYLARQSGTTPGTLAELAPEFAELEQYYTAQVDLRMRELVQYRHAHAVQSDLEQLDQVAAELRAELANAPAGSEERIINAMIYNYKAKLEILERVLEKIQSTNQGTLKTENDEISI